LEGYFDVISSLISFSADFGKFRESPKSSFNFERACISPAKQAKSIQMRRSNQAELETPSLLIAPGCLIDL
jgi:hypothetical protein